MFFRWIIVLCFFYSTPIVFGQIQTEYAERIVVTANRFFENEKKLPVKVSVISKEEIQSSTADNLATLLNQKMAFYIKESPGMTGSVWIRGMKSDDSGVFVSSKVLVLLNGHPSGTGIIDTIPMISIERIEIIEGPSSVSYGSGALSGVINIITPKKSANKIKASFDKGSYDYLKAEFEAGFNPLETFGFVISAGYESKRSYQIGQSFSTTQKKYDQTSYENTGYKNNKAYFGFNTSNDKIILEGSLQYFNADPVGTPNRIFSNDLNDYLKVSRFAADTALKYSLSNQTLFSANAYFNHHKRSNYGIMPPYDYEYHQNILETGFAPSLKMSWQALELTFGINFDYVNLSKIGSNNQYQEPESRYFISGLFLESHFILSQQLHFWLGGRIDYYYSKMMDSQGVALSSSEKTKHFYYPSMRSGFSYLIEDCVFKIYSGTGFTAPSIMQLAGQYDIAGDQYKGNPNLSPENSFSAQATLGYDRIHRFLFTYGYQIVNNRITIYYDAPYKTYKNIDQAQFQFIEADGLLNWGNLLKVRNLFGSINIKGTYYLEYYDKQTGQNLTNAYIPELKAAGGLKIGYFELFLAYLESVYYGKLVDGASGEDIGNFYLLNIGLELTPFLFFWPESYWAPIKISFQIKNLLDQQYEYVDGYPLPGREYRFGISYEYKF